VTNFTQPQQFNILGMVFGFVKKLIAWILGMIGKESPINMEEFNALFGERLQWANLAITIEDIADDNKRLVKKLSKFERRSTLTLLAGLLTLPDLQSNCIRLEILVALALVYCKGKKKPEIKDITDLFNRIGKSRCAYGEDPAEDVLVSLVHDEQGDYRILEGIWEGAGFYTQRMLDVVETMPEEPGFLTLKKCAGAVLRLSDLVCEKSQLERYQIGSIRTKRNISAKDLPPKSILTNHVTITFAELKEKGIELSDISPFLFRNEMLEKFIKQEVGGSLLDRNPIIKLGDEELLVLLPSSLSSALRNYLIEFVYSKQLESSFDRNLAAAYSELIADTPLLGGPINASVQWRPCGDDKIANFVHKVDQGLYASFHFFLPSIRRHSEGGFKDIFEDKGELSDRLQLEIDGVIRQVSEDLDFEKGLIFIVGCGWGKGYSTKALEVKHPKWRLQGLSAADMVRLSALDGVSPTYVWQIQDGLESLKNQGVQIANVNGLLNIIGWIREHEGHLVPHSQLPEQKISLDNPLMMQIPTYMIRDVRADSDKGYDRHCVIDNTGYWHEVMHKSSAPLFPSKSLSKLYVSKSTLKSRTLSSVYEGSNTLWLSTHFPYIKEHDLSYRLWDMTHEWLHRLGGVVDGLCLDRSVNLVVKINVYFEDEGMPVQKTEKPKKELLSSLSFLTEPRTDNSCDLHLKKGFIDGAKWAENVLERIVVANLTRGFLNLLEVKKSDQELEDITDAIVKNEHARSFHIFNAQGFLDYVRGYLPKHVVKLNELDDGVAKLGLGWRAMGGSGSNKIIGKEACCEFLGKVVDSLIADICVGLRRFERKSTLRKLVLNVEKASAEEEHWKRTSAAVLGLHGTNEQTLNAFTNEYSQYAGAAIASRVLIEMALCISPENSQSLMSSYELSKLLVRASLVVRYGGLSDAIYFNTLPPELYVSALGDILFKDDFGEIVVQPMFRRHSGESFVKAAPYQKRNYDEPNFHVSTKEAIGEEFWDIWQQEMGFNIDQARAIIQELEEHFIRQKQVVAAIRESEFYSIVCVKGMPREVATSFLEQFVLKTRKKWDKVPNKFDREDIYPWKFGRRLSFALRPILAFDLKEDLTLLMAPNALRKGFSYLLDGTKNGRLRQTFYTTPKMKNEWWGKASEGHTFNSEVVAELRAQGWTVEEGIGIPQIINKPTTINFGDIDALAWREDSDDILVIECKDLSFSRNYSEAAALLSTFQGQTDEKGKRDKLRLHLDRVEFARENIVSFRDFSGRKQGEITSCIAFSGIVPMQFAKIDALHGTHVGSVDEILESIRTG
jgi:hypothetical protein